MTEPALLDAIVRIGVAAITGLAVGAVVYRISGAWIKPRRPKLAPQPGSNTPPPAGPLSPPPPPPPPQKQQDAMALHQAQANINEGFIEAHREINALLRGMIDHIAALERRLAAAESALVRVVEQDNTNTNRNKVH